MAKQTIQLGGIVKSEVEKINSNFTELYDAEAAGNKSNDLSDYNNDAGFITSADVPTVPTVVSAFTNDAGYQTAAQVSSAITTATADFVEQETGKGLSTNDYTTDDKNKVARLGKIDFTASDFGTLQADGYMYATISAGGKYPVKVFKTNGTKYEEVLVQTDVDGNNIVIGSCSAFAGYVVTV